MKRRESFFTVPVRSPGRRCCCSRLAGEPVRFAAQGNCEKFRITAFNSIPKQEARVRASWPAREIFPERTKNGPGAPRRMMIVVHRSTAGRAVGQGTSNRYTQGRGGTRCPSRGYSVEARIHSRFIARRYGARCGFCEPVGLRITGVPAFVC
jgi:hypothetical protein